MTRNRLVTAGYDGIVRVWSESGKEVSHLKVAGENEIDGFRRFSRDGKSIAIAPRTGLVRIWDLDAGKLAKVITYHLGGVSAIAFSREGKTLATGNTDTTVRFWKANSGATLQSALEHRGLVNSLTFTDDGKLLVTGPETVRDCGI